MSDRVTLTLVLHNHQPVGNFGWVIDDVYEHAYSPMLFALERHPGIHLGLHYTGPLLQWLIANRPEAIDQIRGLIAGGQIEIVGGAFYEPILATLPDRDRHGQLVRMRSELGRLFGAAPRGAWLAERVWEPSTPYDLAAAGYEWTVLDDNHLRGASIPEDEMWTPFTTDDRGQRLTVFGTEQGLRYRIPFRPVEEVIEYLRERVTPDGRFVGMMGDDGEKFGAWPGTYPYCWSHEHWVDRMFEAIEASSDWLSIVTPSEWLSTHPATRRAYFPTASYVEMTEWALPANETQTFVDLLETARAEDSPAARFLRGGFWRNFAVEYREINELHKQMLRVSDKVTAMPPGPKREQALDHLYQGQSNDCYWHGLFGGIYIVHMRMATLAHLIAAEDLADAAAEPTTPATTEPTTAATMAKAPEARPTTRGVRNGGRYGTRLFDTDLDSIDEVLVTSPGQTVVIDLADGAGISSWDLRASRVALASVLRRRPEAYHARLRAAEPPNSGQADAREAASGGPKTIHDIVTVKEPGLADLLHYDRHERRSGVIHLLPVDKSGVPTTASDDFVRADYLELGDFVEEPFEVVSVKPDRVVASRAGSVVLVGRVGAGSLESVAATAESAESALGGRPLTVEKSFRFGGDRLSPTLDLTVSLRNPGHAPLSFELAVEWNVNLLGGGHNPSAYYEAEPGVRTPHDVAGELARADSIAFGNDYEGVRVVASPSPAARLCWYPVETVSNSEAGFERVYQGSSLLFRWLISLAPGARIERRVRFGVSQSIDRAERENDPS